MINHLGYCGFGCVTVSHLTFLHKKKHVFTSVKAARVCDRPLLTILVSLKETFVGHIYTETQRVLGPFNGGAGATGHTLEILTIPLTTYTLVFNTADTSTSRTIPFDGRAIRAIGPANAAIGLFSC